MQTDLIVELAKLDIKPSDLITKKCPSQHDHALTGWAGGVLMIAMIVKEIKLSKAAKESV